ncbi:MAG TPA: nicotinamidase [Vicinamibacterales bacterium]
MPRTRVKDQTAALLVVDMQKDFCPGGALAVPGADRIVPSLNRYLADARARDMPVYASRDWHPPVTSHFKEFGGEWPPHCVQDSEGARFHADLRLPSDAIVIAKGDDPSAAGYSAFEGHTADGATLLSDLQHRHVTRLYVSGVATDYCVRATALDALRNGFDVRILSDAIAGIDLDPGDVDRALGELTQAGARMVDGLDR